MSDFRGIKTIGVGSFGRVVLAKYKHDNEYYALKILSKRQVRRTLLSHLLISQRESKFLSSRMIYSWSWYYSVTFIDKVVERCRIDWFCLCISGCYVTWFTLLLVPGSCRYK